MSSKKKSWLIVLLVCLSVSTFTQAKKSKKNAKSRFEQLEIFNKVFHIIENRYYRNIDTSKLIEGAIKGMMDTLDPHSAFLNKEVFKKMQDDTAGEFGGLGIEVTQKDGYIYIITAMEDTPAYRAGILSNDKIVEINHESVLGLTLDESVDKMKGKIGSVIHLGVVREGKENIQHFSIKRKVIKVKPIKYALLEKQYAYVRLSSFQKRAGSSIAKAIKELEAKAKKNKGLKGIILDLRSNPGGLLNQAVDVSSIFLKDGIVVSTEARNKNDKEIHYVKKTGFKDLKTPMIVLINGASASASEIVAGALQDHKRAMIVGTQSFGKGSVQEVSQLDEESGVKLTIAQYMTPKNRKIQAIGIKPDVVIQNVDYEEFDKITKSSSYIREKDLKNHLTATIETKEEKSTRVAEHKVLRQKRIKMLNDKLGKKKKKTKPLFRKFDPKKDYQVKQSIKILQSISILVR
jgi:carboxyl-terminal processing protease